LFDEPSINGARQNAREAPGPAKNRRPHRSPESRLESAERATAISVSFSQQFKTRRGKVKRSVTSMVEQKKAGEIRRPFARSKLLSV
jgi:hypothetical protein